MEEYGILEKIIRKLKDFRESTWALIILSLCFIYLFAISLISKGLFGDTDSIGHYQIARYAFKYPSLLVDHWGKPLFTDLSAPFAQFGLQGSIFFNILCGLLSALLIYRIAKEFKYKYALLAIPFSLFAPVYMVNLFTSLTEILFGLVLVGGIYFFLKQKNILSAVIISFIPYARTEGIMFLGIFLIAFLLVKKFKAIPFLLTGFIFYSVAGYFHYHKFLWFFSAMPYSQAGSELYGSGSFWFYLERFHQLLGFPLTILAGIGLIRLGAFFRNSKSSLTSSWLTEYYLIPVSLIGFILVHSFLWWQGMMGVLASKRFMACIMPLCGLLAVAGFEFFFNYLGERKLLKKLLLIAIIGITLYVPYSLYEIPAGLSANSEVMKAAANTLLKIGYRNKQVIYFDPKLAFYLNEDPYDYPRIRGYLPDNQSKDYGLADSSFLVWDAHFGEFEHKVYLNDLLENPNFSLIDGFVPNKELKSFKGRNYFALIFQKVPARTSRDEWIMMDSLDFEKTDSREKPDRLTDSVVFSGHKSNRIGNGQEFSFTANKRLSEFQGLRKVILRARIMAFIPEGAEPDKLNLVLLVYNSSGEVYRYVSISGSYFKPEPGKWFQMSLVTPLLTDFPENGSMEVHARYHGKNNIFVDDLVLECLPVKD